MESQKSRIIIFHHLTHGNDGGKGLMNQEMFFLVFPDRFLQDATYRKPLQKPGRTEAKCKGIDDLAQEGHTYNATEKELDRNRSHWTLQLHDSTLNGPMALRDDYKAAVSLNNHLYRQSEDPKADPSAVSRPTARRMQILRNISSRSQN